MGRALYSITKSDNLSLKGFYDYIFNETFFYASELQSYIFPIDNITQQSIMHLKKIDSKR